LHPMHQTEVLNNPFHQKFAKIVFSVLSSAMK